MLDLVRAEGVAALIATHNPTLAARMDRRVTLQNGPNYPRLTQPYEPSPHPRTPSASRPQKARPRRHRPAAQSAFDLISVTHNVQRRT